MVTDECVSFITENPDLALRRDKAHAKFMFVVNTMGIMESQVSSESTCKNAQCAHMNLLVAVKVLTQNASKP